MHEKTKNALDIYCDRSEDEIYLVYRGYISDELTNAFLDVSENTVVDTLGLTKVNRKASFLLVESFQNMLKHTHSESSSQREHEDALFHFRFDGKRFRINSINPILKSEEEALSRAVDEINRLDSVSLKNLYKDRLVQNELSEKGGAGLGLIEMARKSGQRLKYDFVDMDAEKSAFMQQITLAGEDYNAADDDLTDLAALKDFVESEDVILVYKGDLSQKAVVPLIPLLEKNTSANALLSKRAGITMIEMLQNASKHGLNNGVLKLYRKDERIVIEVGNTIACAGAESLMKRMQDLQQMTSESLKKAYQVHLRNVRNLDDELNSGLGLMEIARLSDGNFSFDLKEVGESCFFTLSVTL